MGFFTGRISFVRYRVQGPAPGMFGPEHLERLADHAIGKQRVASSDGTEVGWIAGDHILDTAFDLAKNIVDDALQWALRVDTFKIPSDLLRAYTHVELQGLAAGNPSGHPSARQKREAPAVTRAALQKDGGLARIAGHIRTEKTLKFLFEQSRKEAAPVETPAE